MGETITKNRLSEYSKDFDKEQFQELNEEISFEEYIDRLHDNPLLCRNAFQYMYDMIVAKGVEEFQRYRKTYKKYNFFHKDEESPIFGLEETINYLVDFFHGAAGGFGAQKRILLLHGPVGSSKSTICGVLKRGFERYSKTDEGAWYTFKWVDLPTEGPNFVYTAPEDVCPMNQNPIKLMPMGMRKNLLKNLNKIIHDKDENANHYELTSEGDLNPRCKLFMDALLKQYDGDWELVVKKHIRVIRKVHSEVDRVGIGTFQPKDEKNQDSTELTGDMNFAKIGHFGADSDPRAFNFDGEFCKANRGMVEFIEALKLSNEFLYDLLGASQEHQIKPKKFSQIVIDQVIIAHTNNPEYEKLKNNQFMEALRDRTVKIDIPYLLRWSDEQKVLEQDYGPDKVKTHIMPHTLEVVSLFTVMTRMERTSDLDLRDKAKLYDGREMPGWTEDSVKELRDKHPEEGMKRGLSVRYIQDKISTCLAKKPYYVNVFEVLNEIKEGLDGSSLITNKNEIADYQYCLDLVAKELDDILKTEVQQALVSDDKAIVRLCSKYIEHLMASVDNEKIRDQLTGKDVDPDERLMRSIEEKIGIPEQGAADFRRSIAGFIGKLSLKGETFGWDSNPELKRALQQKMFEDVKDTVKLSIFNEGSTVVDPELQDKIDAIKSRLIKQNGYNDQSATDVLQYVSGIFSRGDIDG